MAPSPVHALNEQGVRRISRSSNCFVSAKSKIKVGNFNVRSLNQVGKLDELIEIFKDYKLDICAVTETKITGIDKKNLEAGMTLLLSGRDDENHYQGVGLLLNRFASKALCEWEPIDERLLYARFKSNHGNLSVVVCYAPINDAADESKDAFYYKLQEALDKVANHDLLICVGDFNSKMGNSNIDFEACMGNEGAGNTMNENGVRFGSFCLANNLVIGGTLFKHSDIHKTTWTSPCGKYKNQIDHIAISKRHRGSLLDVRVKRGADIGSDHQLSVSQVKLKLKIQKSDKISRKKYDIDKLRKGGEASINFRWECRNRFMVLETLEELEKGVDEIWNDVKETLHEAAEQTIKSGRRERRKRWISDQTWEIMQRRKKAKLKSETLRDDHEIEIARAEYWSLHSEVRRLVKRDKRREKEQKIAETEKQINKNEGQSQRIAYKSIRELNGNVGKRKEIPVKDRQGNVLSKDIEIKNRWKEHFETILNRPIPPEEDIPSADRDLDIELGEITLNEVKEAIKQSKSNKAPGDDELFPEMFKVEDESLPAVLTKLFNKIWRTGVVPKDWKDGVIIKIPKKGDLSDCGNWRGITLLPIASKIFSKILLNRMEPAVERMLRDEQAGF